MDYKRIVVMGASSCLGQGDPELGGWAGRLRQWFERQNARNLLYNLGISADSSMEVVQRLSSEATLRKPDLIIIQIGINDTWRDESPKSPTKTPLGQFRENIIRIINDAKSLCDVLVVSIFPIDEDKTTPVSWVNKYYLLEDAKRYSQATKEICQETGTPYLDIFSEWLKGNYKRYLASDGLHANSQGHQYTFEAVKAHLLKNTELSMREKEEGD